jgi:para-nitrobenzyl esterase
MPTLSSPVPATQAPPTTDQPIVRTSHGRLRGARSVGVVVFRGVPYAAPPFGPNRLRRPQPVDSWIGIRDALEIGAEPPQPKLPEDIAQVMGIWDPAVPGEDCLTLDVWTPDLGATGLPVFVWIPGGMFEVGSGATYDGSRFARDGVVCVTINYRVGAEGFMFLDDGTADRGLLDQIAALEWVRDNIAAFGGDPDNVTIAGESAGAMSVGTLLSMPRATGLFRRAIAESGAAHRVIDVDTARLVTRDLCTRIGVEPTTEAVAAVPWERLLAATNELKSEMLARPDPERWGVAVVASALPWQPVIDGEVIPERPIERIAAGAGHDVDVIVGSNTDDWKLFRVLSGDIDRVTEDMLSGPIAESGYLAVAAYGVPVAPTLAAYAAIAPGATPGELLSLLQTDWWCRIPVIRLAEARARASAQTFMYEFAWPSPAFGGRLGACHGLEIPFVFDTVDLASRQMLGAMLGPEPPQDLATEMHTAWVRFAATGDPGWPRYDTLRRTTKRFGQRSTLVDDPRAAERSIWAGLL